MQGFSLLCRALRGRGVERIALEEPGWHVHRLIVEQAGLEIVPIPVDEDGIVVDALARSGSRDGARDARQPVPERRRDDSASGAPR